LPSHRARRGRNRSVGRGWHNNKTKQQCHNSNKPDKHSANHEPSLSVAGRTHYRLIIGADRDELKDDFSPFSDNLSDHCEKPRNYRAVMPGRSEQRKKTAATQSALLDVATKRLITHALDALAGLVTPSILARSSQTVSVDTAYRLLNSPEHTIQMLTTRVIPPEFSSESLHWPTFRKVNVDAIDAIGGESSLGGIHAALCVLLTNNFALPSTGLLTV